MDDGLIFPGVVERAELEFRDGKRIVPGYLVSLMSRIETHRVTYEEAVAIANKLVESDFANDAQANVVAAHFKEQR